MTEQSQTPVALPPAGATVHFVGVGGAGMVGVARILLAQGYRVTGSDRSDGPALDALRALGAEVHVGHEAAYVRGAALVVMTAAVRDDHVEIAAARAAGIPVVKRAVLLGALANARRCIAVAGTHGKSTTSGMIAYILTTLGHAPLFVIGAEVRDLGTSARDGGGPLAVVEADEYDYSFLHLTPAVAVITNIEYDHPDLFPDPATYTTAFRAFVAQVRSGGACIINADQPEIASVVGSGCAVETVGVASAADWRLESARAGDLTLVYYGSLVGTVTLTIAGAHNARNAAMAVAACAAVGVDPREALCVVASYRGVGRRFEVIGERDGVTVIDDYAHHPTEVRATLAAARVRYPGRRIVTVFQPHTYSRAALYAEEFAAALADADLAVVTEIYAAREVDPGTINARQIARGVPQSRGVYGGDLPATVTYLTEHVRPGDVVLTLGAGDITTVGPALLTALAAREET